MSHKATSPRSHSIFFPCYPITQLPHSHMKPDKFQPFKKKFLIITSATFVKLDPESKSETQIRTNSRKHELLLFSCVNN